MKTTWKRIIKNISIIVIGIFITIYLISQSLYFLQIFYPNLGSNLDRVINTLIHKAYKSCANKCFYVDDYAITVSWDLNSIDGREKKSFEEDNIKLKPIDPKNISSSMTAIDASLKVYPKDFVKSEVSKIYIVGDIDFNGANSAGTFGTQSLYLTNKGTSEGYTNSFMSDSFHHELAHLLKGKYSEYFDENEWLAANPSSFHYGTGGRDAIVKGEFGHIDQKDLLNKGFISDYAQASIEEDFAVTSGALFTNPKETLNTARNYPKIMLKVEMVENFYNKIDPRFTKEYFMKL